MASKRDAVMTVATWIEDALEINGLTPVEGFGYGCVNVVADGWALTIEVKGNRSMQRAVAAGEQTDG